MFNFMKILPVEAELLHADGRADMAKVIVSFPNFAHEPKNPSPIRNLTPAVRPAAPNSMKIFKRTAPADCPESRTANDALRHARGTLCVGVLHFQNNTVSLCMSFQQYVSGAELVMTH